MVSWLGVSAGEAGEVLAALGFRKVEADGKTLWRPARKPPPPQRAPPRRDESPFAVLRR
jgi:hypothetical protein